jgi:hypothetical protein
MFYTNHLEHRILYVAGFFLDVLQYGNVYRSQTIYYQARCSTELHSKKNNIGFSLNILI